MKEREPSSLKDLGDRLKRAQTSRSPEPREGGLSGFGLAFRIGAELVAGLVVGLGIGWALDAWLGTGPWLLILFFFLGAGAGVLNVWRSVKGYGLAVGYKNGKDVPKDETRNKDDDEDDDDPEPWQKSTGTVP